MTSPDPTSAAAGAMERYCDERGIPMPSPGLARQLAEVAAPHLAAADREREATLDHCPGCQHRYGTCGCSCCAHVAQAVAAERERIAQLAGRHAAAAHAIRDIVTAASLADFAKLIRAEGA